MKFYETHFEDYCQSVDKYNMHEELIPQISRFPKNIRELSNIIVYGPTGVGKYSQTLSILKKYSPSQLKYDKKITVDDDKVTAFVLWLVKFTFTLGIPLFELSITENVNIATSDRPLPPAPLITIDLSLGTAVRKLIAEGIAAGGALTENVADVVIVVVPTAIADAVIVPAPVPTPELRFIFATPLASVNAVPLAGDNTAVVVSIENVTTMPFNGAPTLSKTVTFASNELVAETTLLVTPFVSVRTILIFPFGVWFDPPLALEPGEPPPPPQAENISANKITEK